MSPNPRISPRPLSNRSSSVYKTQAVPTSSITDANTYSDLQGQENQAVVKLVKKPNARMGTSNQIAFPQSIQDSIQKTSEELMKNDIFRIDGFVRIDGKNCPAKVSQDLWDTVFPYDYEAVKKIAGKLYILGLDPDEAVSKAVEQIEINSWKSGKLMKFRAVLEPLFEDKVKITDIPHQSVQQAILSIQNTAEFSGMKILESSDQRSTAFKERTWHCAQNHCLVCGKSTTQKDPVFQGDAIHIQCKSVMKNLGPAFSQLVIDQVNIFNNEGKFVQPLVDCEQTYSEDELE